MKEIIKKFISEHIEKNVHKLESPYEFKVGDDTIKIACKIDAFINSVTYSTDSVEPCLLNLVDEMNYENMDVDCKFYGSADLPLLKVDEKLYFGLVWKDGCSNATAFYPKAIPLFENTECLHPTIKTTKNIQGGDWVYFDDNYWVSYNWELWSYQDGKVVRALQMNIPYVKLIF